MQNSTQSVVGREGGEYARCECYGRRDGPVMGEKGSTKVKVMYDAACVAVVWLSNTLEKNGTRASRSATGEAATKAALAARTRVMKERIFQEDSSKGSK